jgi:hypothetical protein
MGIADGWSEWVKASIAFVALASRPDAAAGALGFGVVVSKDGVVVGLISV